MPAHRELAATRLTPAALLTIILPALALPAVAVAQSTGLEDMLGARAGQAEGAIERRGWQNTGGQKGDDRSYTYWWNADRRQCVTIATMDGRYNSITPTTPGDCRQSVSRPSRPEYGYGAQPARPPRSGYQVDPAYGRSPDRHDGELLIDGRPVDLGLVCFGDGARNGVASGTTWTWNREHDRYEYGRYSESTREVFDASLMVQIWDGGGRIRLPKKLIPRSIRAVIRAGGTSTTSKLAPTASPPAIGSTA